MKSIPPNHVACTRCGRRDLPLHVNGQCAECGPATLQPWEKPSEAGTIVLGVDCVNDECGMLTYFKFWTADGSYERVSTACLHYKKMPDRAEVRRQAGLPS